METRSSTKKIHLQDELKEETILRQLSQFIRKQPDQEGAWKLEKFSKNSDLSYAETLITAAKRYFGQALKQWSKYEQKIQDHLTNFMNNIHTKIHHSKLTHLQYIFKPLKDLYQKVTKKEVVLLSETLMQESDQVVQKQVKQKESQILKAQSERTYNIVSDTDKQNKSSQQQVLVPLKMIGNKLESSRVDVWKQIFFKINLIYSPYFRLFSKIYQKMDQKKIDIIKQNQQKSYKDLVNTIQWKQIQNTEQPNTNYRDCACCINYVHEDQDLSYPAFPQPVAFLSKFQYYGVMQKQIKSHIVGFLNGKGGVLFLGCQLTKDGRIIPHLDKILQSEKAQAQDKFNSYFKDIYPSIQLKRHIDLSFIPIAQSIANCPKRQVKWLHGVYILRIVVTPLEPHNTYHYKMGGLLLFAKHTSRKIVEIQKQEIYQFMKKRYMDYNVKMIGGLRERGNLIPTLVKHNGACRGAEKGKQDFGAHPQFQRLQNINEGSNPLLTDRSTYKSVSLLVVDQALLTEIKKLFHQRQKIQMVIDRAFPQKQFRLSNNTWLVWHNVKFQKVMAGLKKEQATLKQKNGKKPPHLISTCPCVRVIGSLSKQAIEDTKKAAEKESKQKVEIKYIESQIYFKTISSITAVFIYYYLYGTHKIKSVFQKIPTGSGIENKQVSLKVNDSRMMESSNAVSNRPKANKQPEHTTGPQRNITVYYERAYSDQQNYEKHSPQKITNQVESQINKKEETIQNSNNYNQVSNQELRQFPQPLLSRYDEFYNIWHYCKDGYLYCVSNNGTQIIGYRAYEQWQLQQQLQQLQQYQQYN